MLTAVQIAAALTLQGQTPPAPPPPPQRQVVVVRSGDGPGRLDANGDGSVSREEFAAPLNTAFAEMDKDGDGRLSTEELAAGGSGGPDGDVMFWRGEPGHGDGEVRRFEMRRGPGGEGGARVEERTMVFTSGGPEGGPVVVRGGPGGGEERVMVFTGGDGPGHGPMVVGGPGGDREVMVFVRGEGPGGHGPMRMEHPGGHGGDVQVRMIGGPGGHHGDMDADGDGRITEEEFLAPMRDAFRRMDADSSGAIEEGEHRGGERQVHVITRDRE